MQRTVRLSFTAGGAAVLLAGSAMGQSFVGNLAVSQLGRLSSGQAQGSALSNAATTTSIRDYSASVASALLNQTYYFNDSSSGTRLTISGTATSSGYLRNSANNRYLTLAGYDAAQGTAGVTATASVTTNRVVGRLDLSTGAIEYTRISDAFSGDNIRSAVTDDGSQYWIGGTGTNPGVRSLTHNTSTPQTSTQLSTTVTNVRNVDIIDGQLFVSTGSGAFNGLNSVGSGIPSSSGQTISNFNGMDNGPDTSLSTFDYFFADANTLYLADDRTSGNGGLEKWTLSSGTWTLRWALRALDHDNNAGTADLNLGLRGLTGQVQSDGSVSLFGVTTESASVNFLVGFSDTLSATSLPVGTKFNLLDTSATNTVFRGVDLVPAPGTAALAMVAALVSVRRRRA